jgi:hypothetical protein
LRYTYAEEWETIKTFGISRSVLTKCKNRKQPELPWYSTQYTNYEQMSLLGVRFRCYCSDMFAYFAGSLQRMNQQFIAASLSHRSQLVEVKGLLVANLKGGEKLSMLEGMCRPSSSPGYNEKFPVMSAEVLKPKFVIAKSHSL